MRQLVNAYADAPRLRTVAATLKITIEAANQAFAQYVPRDAVEADMVEQILLTRARINTATARVLSPELAPALAARIDQTINAMTRVLRGLIDRLELRQNRPTWNLPQQYWRVEPVLDVGPVMDEDPPAPQPASESTGEPTGESTGETIPAATPSPAAGPVPPIVLGWPDPPACPPQGDGAGDALARFAAMRVPADMPAEEAWAIAAQQAGPGDEPWTMAAQQAGQGGLNHKLRRAQERNRAA